VTQRRYEVRLLRFLWRHGFGVFTCDEFQIFSNISVVELFAADDESAPEDLSIPVTVINASLSADDQAGRWNANVFVHVWRRVFLERRYKRYDWTLKLDVDTVFFPDRLRDLLLTEPCGGGACGAVYIRQNWTKLAPWIQEHLLPVFFQPGFTAMWGPLEALSRDAVELFRRGFSRCRFEAVVGATKGSLGFTGLLQGVIADIWGDVWSLHEDVFVDRCLYRLGAHPVVANRLLSDKLELSSWGSTVRPCTEEFAGYHPHKSNFSYLQCMRSAGVPAQLRRAAQIRGSRGDRR